jgi:hypothetical protein
MAVRETGPSFAYPVLQGSQPVLPPSQEIELLQGVGLTVLSGQTG